MEPLSILLLGSSRSAGSSVPSPVGWGLSPIATVGPPGEDATRQELPNEATTFGDARSIPQRRYCPRDRAFDRLRRGIPHADANPRGHNCIADFDLRRICGGFIVLRTLTESNERCCFASLVRMDRPNAPAEWDRFGDAALALSRRIGRTLLAELLQ